MKKNWEERVMKSLTTASMSGCGQSIQILRDMAGAKSIYEKRQVSSYLRPVAYFSEFNKGWVLRE